jgi:hypothetical protein
MNMKMLHTKNNYIKYINIKLKLSESKIDFVITINIYNNNIYNNYKLIIVYNYIKVVYPGFYLNMSIK